MDNRPQGREKNITGHAKQPVGRRGNGLGTGPVGSHGGYSGRTGQGGSGGPNRSSGSSGGGLIKIILLLVVLLGGGGGAMSLFGGSSGDSYSPAPQTVYTQPVQQPQSVQQSNPLASIFGTSGSSTLTQGFNYSSLMSQGSSSSASGWLGGNNTGKLNTSVDTSAKAKRTKILGNGKDTVTIMVYMCGTDLESKSAMATKDLQEMIGANVGKNVNLLVYTGGCTQWRNNIISSSVNQIYKVENGGLKCLEQNAGNGAMTMPATLSSFIKYCAGNYPANRNMLILWDHGGGSISGYGYDEKNKTAGSMTLKGLNEALADAKMQFDFIGYDACLMATLETALTMAPYADYLIASEETEPGVGWYYTDWLSQLSNDASMATVEVGKKIADDFVGVCAQKCPGQKTTLSVIDLAELTATVPEDFKAFSASTLQLLKNDGYDTVSSARSSVREFAASNKLDQIDLVHLALKLDTKESKALADTILAAVKYNKTSADMTNAYGLSLYFPYQKVSKVDSAVAQYNAIGIDSEYTDCIRAFASMELSGQTAAGGTTSPITALGGQSYGASAVGGDMLVQVLGQLLGANAFFDRSVDMDYAAEYIEANRFDADALMWQDGVLHMSEEQWSKIRDLELNVFVDDGEGYIDLGLDNTFDFTENGDLIGSYDGTWLAIDGQVVAYYHIDTTVTEDGYTITGRVPVMLNGDRAELIIVFTSDEPYGYIAGARMDYHDGETDTIAKGVTELSDGDVIDFICDYYTYDGSYADSYYLGDQYIYHDGAEISNVYLDSNTSAMYRLTDIYNVEYWTPVIPG